MENNLKEGICRCIEDEKLKHFFNNFRVNTLQYIPLPGRSCLLDTSIDIADSEGVRTRVEYKLIIKHLDEVETKNIKGG